VQNPEAVVFWNVTRSTRLAKTSIGLLFAAIDCLTRSSPEHLRLSIFFHNRDWPCFDPAMSSISVVLRKVSGCAMTMGLILATIANLIQAGCEKVWQYPLGNSSRLSGD
jgi:hypothetical protein